MFFRGRREGQPAPGSGSAGEDPSRLLIDAETDLHQEWYFDLRAREEVARCARYGGNFVLIFWEPRLIAGERVDAEMLADGGRIVLAGIRSSDLGGRLGRCRLAALLIQAGPDLARSLTHRMKVDLANGQRTRAVPWRGGFAVFPDDGNEYDVVSQAANRRLVEDLGAAA